MKKHVAATLVVIAAVSTPSHAQSIVDTFRQLKGTLKQLGGLPADAPKSLGVSPAAEPTGPGDGDDSRMIPSSVIVDDPSDTALEQAAAAPRRVAGFDIRGFRLGMSPREVGRVGDRQKFRRRWNSLLLTSGSFEVEATTIANYQLNRPVEKSSKVQLKAVEAFDPAGNQVKLGFTLEPSGPKLSDITYTAKLDGMTKPQTVAALTAKYGPPTGNDLTVYWDNKRNYVDNSSAQLGAVIDGGSMMLQLTQSVDYLQAAKRRLNDRAQQIAAAKGGGVKF